MDLVRIAYRSKFGAQAPGAQFGAQTANHANSASPSSATLSNTAAGYTTLGGKWQFVPVSGAATDYALFGYQVPSTHNLIVTGVSISAHVFTALGGPAVLDWSLGVNSTAVSLATTDADPVFGPRRLPVGAQTFTGAAPAAGLQAPDLVRNFGSPLIIQKDRFLHVILQLPLMTVTTGLVRGDVMIDGWFEGVGLTNFG